MSVIRQLTPEVIGKIAAGEVVENPSAAIKELVENSIDAGATAVTVEIRDGGISYFRVTDNGSGIEPGQIRLAFARHATSKLVNSDELTRISTMGFRGEALASIAAVSKVTCTTRTADMPNGIRAVNEGGVITDLQDAACPCGTTFVVQNLFYNTPVRLKFLKKPATEAGMVGDVLTRMILSHPEISFRYVNQGKTVYHSPGDGKLASAVFSIFGREGFAMMRKVHENYGGILVDGFVGVGELARGNRNQENFFINGRTVRNSVLSMALEQGCRERVMIGRFPVCVLHLTMPFETVDVNVHPNKLEVRFTSEANVYAAVQMAVEEALKEATPLDHAPVIASAPAAEKEQPLLTKVPVMPAAEHAQATVKKASVMPKPIENTAEKPKMTVKRQGETKPEPVHSAPVQSIHIAMQPSVIRMEENAEKNVAPVSPIVVRLPETKKPEMKPEPVQQKLDLGQEKPEIRLIGSVFDTYILASCGEQLFFMDQHAICERLLFDKLLAQAESRTISQLLLVAQTVPVSTGEAALIEAHQQELTDAGFEVELMDDTTALIRAVPAIPGMPRPEVLLKDAMQALDEFRPAVTTERRRAMLLQSACKHAVKGGEKLSDAVLKGLVDEMMTKGVTPTCPHGRPLVVSISHTELDKRFKRIV